MTELNQTASIESVAPTAEELEFDDTSPTRPDRESTKSQRRLDARTWEPRFGGAALRRTIELGNPDLRRWWNVMFVRYQVAVHAMLSVLPNVGSMDEAEKAVQALGTSMDAIENELNLEFERLRVFAERAGYTELPAKDYGKAEKVEVRSYTPAAGRWLRLIQRLDDLFWQVDYLWLDGSMNYKHRWELIFRWRNLMWGQIRSAQNSWIATRKLLRERTASAATAPARTNGKGAAKPEAEEVVA